MKKALEQYFTEQTLLFYKYKYFIYELVCIFIILIDFVFLTIETNVLKLIFLALVLMLGFGNLIFIRIKGKF